MTAQEHEVSAKDLVREIGYNLDGDYLVGGECCVCKGPLVHAFGCRTFSASSYLLAKTKPKGMY